MGKYIFGDTSKEAIIEIPQGQLYLVRPLSPKGYSELIFKDAAASVRRTAQEFQYQLVIQRAYEEGEAELAAEGGEDAEIDALAADKDEKGFLLDESLHFRSEIREDGQKVLAWRDLSGDPGDLYEFVCDKSVQASEVATFEMVAIKCQYERKYKKNQETASEKDLYQFSFSGESVPSASPVDTQPGSQSPLLRKDVPPSKALATKEEMPKGSRVSNSEGIYSTPTKAPQSAVAPAKMAVLAKETAELHLFDFQSESFMIQNSAVTATVFEAGKWQYWMQVSSAGKELVSVPVIADLNPVFNFEYLSFIFNEYNDDGAFSWLLRFKNQESEERFQNGLMQALWEQLHEQKWLSQKDNERDYVLDAFNDLELKDAPIEEDEEEEDFEDDAKKSEHYDSDESAEDEVVRDDDGNVNSQLAVGFKHDRSFVVRGSKIGVFKHTPNDNLEFSTNISKVQTPKGKLFSPKKVMLHAQDSNMIMQNETDPNSLYKMDLEYGKIVDEWKVHDDIPVNTFAPEKVGILE